MLGRLAKIARTLFCAVLAVACLSGQAQTQHTETEKSSKQDPKLDAQQYMEIMGNAIQILQNHYVDSIDWARILTAGIDAMCEELDPYTQFFSEADQSDFKTMTTGEYAGIGAIIQQRGDTVVIAQPYKGMPAVEAGLKIGDRILAIDGVSQIGKTTSQVSEKLRGQPNTSFEIKIQRPYEPEPMVRQIVRRRIVMDVVPYSGWLNDSIGYIVLNSFTDKAAQEVQAALVALKQEKPLKGLVLDLRNNGGGLLDEAVKIVGMFVPMGSTVVETKAKLAEWNSTYKTNVHPIEPDLPLAVLVNRGSASASEIVSGALQDLDRAVILGERSYGKGLVQSTRPMPYNTLIKFTSAKYYIPSGRCIQAIDYQARRMARWEAGMDESEDLGRIPDSLTHVFHTANGREVRDGGGIKPDVERKPRVMGNLAYYLERENLIFDFCTRFCHENSERHALTDAEYDQFCQGAIQARKDSILDLMKIKLVPELDSLKSEIVEMIDVELALRYEFLAGQIREVIKGDDLVKEAAAILGDDKRYSEILRPAPADRQMSKGKNPNKKRKNNK